MLCVEGRDSSAGTSCVTRGGTKNANGVDEAFVRAVNDNDVEERAECDARTKAMLYM